MNVLYLYNSTQTFTSTVYEHIFSFYKNSKFNTFFAHQDRYSDLNIDFSNFEVLIIHYTIRLPYDQIAESTAQNISQFQGLKVLFIQDEYDHTHKAWSWIKRLGINLVFTVVPTEKVESVYPSAEFPNTKFVSVLTGYVPEDLPEAPGLPPSQRSLFIGYRGRSLPTRYGQLGFEKIGVGKLVKEYALKNRTTHDIEWDENSRIYGDKWYPFIASCRATLGSESGSNVFDWDGTLWDRIKTFKLQNPNASEDEIYKKVIEPLEVPGLMNQISPRIFEAIALRTGLVLFEGTYSNVVKAGDHFIPLKKDGSNIAEVFRLLNDGAYLDAMTERAYRDVIESKKYSHAAFSSLIDTEIEKSYLPLRKQALKSEKLQQNPFLFPPSPITTMPLKFLLNQPKGPLRKIISSLSFWLPGSAKHAIKKCVRDLFKSISSADHVFRCRN